MVPSNDSRWLFLVVGVAGGLVVGLLIGAVVLAPSTSPSHSASVPQALPTVSTCFGGGDCNGTSPTTNGSGTQCVVSGFEETAGDFLYVAINYAGGTDLITSVTDGGGDTFDYVAGEFAYNQSVAFYDVPSEHGGAVSITVAIRQAEFGACTVGQLSAGTTVGSAGPGGGVPSEPRLTVTNDVSHAPSLLLALFGATRPTGTPTVTASYPGSPPWNLANQWTGSTYDGTAQVLYGENVYASGTVEFTWQVGNSQTPSISGLVVEFYLGT